MRKSLMLARSLFANPHRSNSLLPKHIQPSLDRLTPQLVALIKEQSSSGDDTTLRKTLQDVISAAYFNGAKSLQSQKEVHVHLPRFRTPSLPKTRNQNF